MTTPAAANVSVIMAPLVLAANALPWMIIRVFPQNAVVTTSHPTNMIIPHPNVMTMESPNRPEMITVAVEPEVAELAPAAVVVIMVAIARPCTRAAQEDVIWMI